MLYETYNLFGADPDVVSDCNTNSNIDTSVTPLEEQQCAIDLCIVEGRFTLALFSRMAAGLTNDADYHGCLLYTSPSPRD